MSLVAEQPKGAAQFPMRKEVILPQGQGNSQPDAEIAEKRPFRTETG